MSDDKSRRDEENQEIPVVRRLSSRLQGGADLLDAVLKALTNHRRRYALYYLQDRGVSEVDELARYIAANEAQSRTIDEAHFAKTKNKLMHSDLPLLTDVGFISYDPRSKAVQYTDPPSLLNTFLTLTHKIDDPKID